MLASAACQRSSADRSVPSSGPAARVAASNSYLEAAARDVLDSPAPIVRLAEPGTCPGHFDIRPSQVNDLRRCRLLMRFEFQKSLDTALGHLVNNGLNIREVRLTGSLCEPPNYLSACRQVAEILVGHQVTDRQTAEQRLRAIEARVTAQGAWCREQIARSGWAGRSVLCSAHQEGFCKWLGLQVATTFSGADSASIGQIEQAIRAGDAGEVSAVIANLPEGRRLADALGRRLNARVVVFGNFPSMQGEGPAFDELLTANLRALLEAEPN